MAATFYCNFAFKFEGHQMKLQMRIKMELEDVVLVKWVGLIARNIKDAKSRYGLKRQSDHPRL